MERKCVSCKERPAGKAGYTGFDYKDPKRILIHKFKFRIFKHGSFCSFCEEKKHIKKFNEHSRKLIISDIDSWIVDWQFYCQSRKDRGGRAGALDDILVSLDIMSVKAANNWNIVGDGNIGWNPYWHSSYLYFTLLRYAKDFALANYGLSGNDDWEIHKIDEVMSKQDIVRSFKED